MRLLGCGGKAAASRGTPMKRTPSAKKVARGQECLEMWRRRKSATSRVFLEPCRSGVVNSS